MISNYLTPLTGPARRKAMTRTTTKSRKWKTAALSHLLRNRDCELSHDLRELIADRLDNQVVEINQLRSSDRVEEEAEYLREVIVPLLRARVEELKAALQKIRTEPGDARDCRYIAGHALATKSRRVSECPHLQMTPTGFCFSCGEDVYPAATEQEGEDD
jgi:hypothetical protein